MNVVLRFLGFEAAAALGRRLPPRAARLVSLGLLLFANLLPILLVLIGQWQVGDVFLIYWIENVILWLVTIIRLTTVAKPGESGAKRIATAGFFTVHYGIFTLVHGVFTGVIVAMTGGLHSTPAEMLLTALLILGSHLYALAMNWFGREQRRSATIQSTMWQPYPRMLVLHVSIIAGFALMMNAGNDPFGTDSAGEVRAVLLLCGLKTLLELGLSWALWMRAETGGNRTTVGAGA